MSTIKPFNIYKDDFEFAAAKHASPDVSYIIKRNEMKYNNNTLQDTYFTIHFLSAGTFTFIGNAYVDYSTNNGGTWSTLAPQATSPEFSADDYVRLRASISNSGSTLGTIEVTGKYEVLGNFMSLVAHEDFPTAYRIGGSNFVGLFANNNNLVSAENLILPAIDITQSCYQHMFEECRNMEHAPKILPAKNVPAEAYEGMFNGCRKLTDAPQINAEKVGAMAMKNMFYGCTSLTVAPELGFTELDSGGTNHCIQMFYGCTGLTQAPSNLYPDTYNYCYDSMFANCTSLQKAPVLHAKQLASSAYRNMFKGCSSLNYVKDMYETAQSNSRQNMFDGVPSTGTCVQNYNCVDSWTPNSGWTIIKTYK